MPGAHVVHQRRGVPVAQARDPELHRPDPARRESIVVSAPSVSTSVVRSKSRFRGRVPAVTSPSTVKCCWPMDPIGWACRTRCAAPRRTSSSAAFAATRRAGRGIARDLRGAQRAHDLLLVDRRDRRARAERATGESSRTSNASGSASSRRREVRCSARPSTVPGSTSRSVRRRRRSSAGVTDAARRSATSSRNDVRSAPGASASVSTGSPHSPSASATRARQGAGPRSSGRGYERAVSVGRVHFVVVEVRQADEQRTMRPEPQASPDRTIAGCSADAPGARGDRG